MSEFDGKIVLITGCGRVRGIGRAIAVAFARAGADLVVTDLAAGGTRNEGDEGLEEKRLGWDGLESLAGEIRALGRRVLTLVGVIIISLRDGEFGIPAIVGSVVVMGTGPVLYRFSTREPFGSLPRA